MSAAPKRDATPAAIDRAHLKQMTLGDDALAREVLAMFDKQAATMIERMRGADRGAQTAMAHALKGSARGIGAWRVAEAAAAFEKDEDELTTLAAAIALARGEIAQILKKG